MRIYPTFFNRSSSKAWTPSSGHQSASGAFRSPRNVGITPRCASTPARTRIGNHRHGHYFPLRRSGLAAGFG